MENGSIHTVWDVIAGFLRDGEKVVAITIHRHPFLTDKWYTAGSTRKNVKNIEDVTRSFLPEALNRPLAGETAKKYFLYDEEFGKTVDMTVWTENSVLIHRWVASCSHTLGDRTVRFQQVDRNPTDHNPIAELFRRFTH